MKKVFLVLVMLGLLVSCSSKITQYGTIYKADKITFSGDKSCEKLEGGFMDYAVEVYKYNHKYMAGFSLLNKRTSTVPAFVLLSGNNISIWIKDKPVIDDNDVKVIGTLTTNFNTAVNTAPDTTSVSWDVYYQGHLICHFEVTGSKSDSLVLVFSKDNRPEIYKSLKSAFDSFSSDYIVKE